MDPEALSSRRWICGGCPGALIRTACRHAHVLAAAQPSRAVVVEDAAQAHGASVVDDNGDARRVGSLGIIAAFSFYPGKNLGAFGDAGAVTTDDAQLEERVERLRDHGRISKYVYAEPGFCERLDTIQAAVLELRLKKLDAANLARRELADRYRAELDGVGDLRLPAFIPERPGVYHLFVVRTAHRRALLEHLHGNGVQAGIHYPVPIHLQPAWEHLGYRQGDFPVSEAWARECLSLPIYPELAEAQLSRVVAEVSRFFSGLRRS